MNRYCFALGIVFALAVVPQIVEAQLSDSSIVAPSGVRETSQGASPWNFSNLNLDLDKLPFPWNLCGLFSFVEIAFTGCLLTCFMPPRRRRTRK